MKFHFFVTLDAKQDWVSRAGPWIAERVRNELLDVASRFPVDSHTVEVVHRTIGATFEKGIAEGHPPVVVQAGDVKLAVPMVKENLDAQMVDWSRKPAPLSLMAFRYLAVVSPQLIVVLLAAGFVAGFLVRMLLKR